MKTSVVPFIVVGILLFFIPFPLCPIASLVCFAIAIAKCLKKFLFELIDHIKGTDSPENK